MIFPGDGFGTRRFFFTIILSICCGCVPFEKKQNLEDIENATVIEEVTFQPTRQEYYCGPEALSPILTFYGKSTTPARIGNALMEPGENGVTILELKQYAESKNINTRIRKGSMEFIEKSIDRKRPLIVLIEFSRKQDIHLLFGTLPLFRVNAVYHFFAIVGYSDRYVFVLGPDGKAGLPKEQLINLWKPMDYATLELWPPN